jgi:hypothetical protein
MKTIKLVTVCIFCCATAHAQWSANIQQDRHILSTFFSQTVAEKGASISELIIQSALFFLNTPYVGHTLEVGDEERLVINLRELDCTTFMETCVALSRTLQMNTPYFDAYCKNLERIRYRNGVVNGYVSRLHYTTDWIADNVSKGILEDVTEKIGGVPLDLQLTFMSSNPDSYVHLKGQPERTARIKQVEDIVNKRGTYHYIPKEKIPSIQGQIRSGDLICFTTSMKGMDVSHVAIAYWQNGVLTFIHASSTAKKVTVEPDTLVGYCEKIRSNTGIIVLRVR